MSKNQKPARKTRPAKSRIKPSLIKKLARVYGLFL